MKYLVIENFIDENLCNNLVSSAKNLESELFSENIIHNGRNFISCTSEDFLKLKNSNNSWRDFSSLLESKDFTRFAFSKLNLKIDSYEFINLYKSKDLLSFLKNKKRYNAQNINNLSSKRILWFLLLRFIQRMFLSLRLVKYFFLNKNPLELLFDFSIAQNGYSLPIHRDTDARIIIFLIYLNDVTEGSIGGNFNLFKLKENKGFFPKNPNPSDCDLVESISPKTGRAIFIDGSMDSYHSVDKMIDHNEKRYFIYGSFTSLLKKNDLIDYKKTEKYDTEFNLYE